jgi:hypothetical protein
LEIILEGKKRNEAVVEKLKKLDWQCKDNKFDRDK